MGVLKPNIRKMKERENVEGLIKALRHKDGDVQEAAIGALGEIGQPAVVSLTQALGDRDSGVRRRAVRALGKIGNAEAIEALVQTLKNEDDSWVRGEAAEALGDVGNGRAIEPLVQSLEDRNWRVRNKAALALDKLSWKPGDRAGKIYYAIAKKEWNELVGSGEPAVEPLIRALELDTVHGEAALALGRIGDPRAIEPLIQAMRKEMEIGLMALTAIAGQKVGLRVMTAEALVRMGEPAIEPLVQVLRDENAFVREGAALALANMGESAVERLTVVALEDEHENVRSAAKAILEKIGASPSATRVCPQCGSEMEAGKKFCTQCGTGLSG